MVIIFCKKNKLYVNVTNKCTNLCTFCRRAEGNFEVEGQDLKLKEEPSSDKVISEIKKNRNENYDEIILGFLGEALIRIDTVIDIFKFVKDNYPWLKKTVYTNGLINLHHRTDITPLLKDLVDEISVVLNASDKESYYRLCRPTYGYHSFDEVIDFISRARKNINEVTVSCDKKSGVELKNIEKLLYGIRVKEWSI